MAQSKTLNLVSQICEFNFLIDGKKILVASDANGWKIFDATDDSNPEFKFTLEPEADVNPNQFKAKKENDAELEDADEKLLDEIQKAIYLQKIPSELDHFADDPQHKIKSFLGKNLGRIRGETEEYHSYQSGGKFYKLSRGKLKVRDNENAPSKECGLEELEELFRDLEAVKERQLGFGVAEGSQLNLYNKKQLVSSILASQPDDKKSEAEAIKIANQFLGFDVIVGGSGVAGDPYIFRGAVIKDLHTLVSRFDGLGNDANGNLIPNPLKSFVRAINRLNQLTNIDAFASSNIPELKNLAGVFYEFGIHGQDGLDEAQAKQNALENYQAAMNGGCVAALDSVMRLYENILQQNADELDDVNNILGNLREVLNKPESTIKFGNDEIKVELVRNTNARINPPNGGLKVTKDGQSFLVKADCGFRNINGVDLEVADSERAKAIISEIGFVLGQEDANKATYVKAAKSIKTVNVKNVEQQIIKDFASIGGYISDTNEEFTVTEVENGKYDLKKAGTDSFYRISFEQGVGVKITKRDKQSKAVDAQATDAQDFSNWYSGLESASRSQYGWAKRSEGFISKLDQISNSVADKNNEILFAHEKDQYFIKRNRDNPTEFEIGKRNGNVDTLSFQIVKNNDGTLTLNKRNAADNGFEADEAQNYLDATKLLQAFKSPLELIQEVANKIPSETLITVLDKSNPASHKNRYFVVDKSGVSPSFKEYFYEADGSLRENDNPKVYSTGALVDADKQYVNELIALFTPHYLQTPAQAVEQSRNLSQLSYDLRMAIENHPQAQNDSGRTGKRIYSLPNFAAAAAGGDRTQYKMDVAIGSKILDGANNTFTFEQILQENSKIRKSQNSFGIANTGISEEQKGELISKVAAQLQADEKYRATIIVAAFLGIDKEGVCKATPEGVKAVLDDKKISNEIKDVLKAFARDKVAGLEGPNGLNLKGVFYELVIHVDPNNPNQAQAVTSYQGAAAALGDETDNSKAGQEAGLKNLIRCYQKGIFGSALANNATADEIAAEKASYKQKGDYLEALLWAVKQEPAKNEITSEGVEYKVTKQADSSFQVTIAGANSVSIALEGNAVAMPHPAPENEEQKQANHKFKSVLEKFVTQRAHAIAKENIATLGRINDGLSFVGATSANLTIPVPARLTADNEIISKANTNKIRVSLEKAGNKEYYQCFRQNNVTTIRQVDTDGNPIKDKPYYELTIDARGVVSKVEQKFEGVLAGSYSLNPQDEEVAKFVDIVAGFERVKDKTKFDNAAEVSLVSNPSGRNPLATLERGADDNYGYLVRTKFQGTVGGEKSEFEITKESATEYFITKLVADPRTKEVKAEKYAKIVIYDNNVTAFAADSTQESGFAVNAVDAEKFWEIKNLLDGLVNDQKTVTKAEALFDDRLREMEVDKQYSDNGADLAKVYFVKTLDSKGNPTLHQYKRNADGVFTEVEKGQGFELARGSLEENVAGSFKSWIVADRGDETLKSDITNFLNVPEIAAPLFIDRNVAADDVDVLGYETVKIGKKKYNAYRVDDTLYVDDSFKNYNGDVKHLIKRVDSSITGKTLTELDGFETAKAVSDIISEVKRREVEVGVKETRDYLIGKIRQIMPIESEENKKSGDIVDAFLGLRKLQAGEEYPTDANSGLDNKVKKLLKSYADHLAHQEEGEHQVRNLEITEREFQSIHQINPSLRKHFVSVFYDNRAIDRQIGKEANVLKAESQALYNSYAVVNGDGLGKEIYAQEAARGNIYAAKELAEILSRGNDKEKENGAFLKKALEIVGHNGLTTKQDSIQYQVSFEAYKGIVVKKFDKDGKESEVGRVVFNKSAKAGAESFEITPKSLKQVIQSLEQKSKLETVQDVELSTVETTMRSIAGIFNEKMSAEAKTLHKQEKQKTQVTRNQIQEGKIEEVKKDLIDNLSKIKPYTTPQVTDLVNKLLDNKNEAKPTVLSLQSVEFRKIFLDFVSKNAQVFANSEIDSFKDLAGQFYLGGVGVEVSHTKAQKCFQEASGAVINAQNELSFKPQGNGLAAYHLSLMYEKGSGEVAKNEAFAQSCLEEAAKKGVEVAKAKIAYKKFYGEGLEQNKTEAVRELKSIISTLNPEVLRIQSQIALDTSDMRFAEAIYKKSKSILESKDPLVKKDDPALYEAMANTIRCGAEISTTKQEAHDRIVNLYSMGKNLGDLRCAKKIYEFTQSRTEVIDIFTKVVEAANTPNYSVNISGSKLKSGDYKVKSTSFGYEITLGGIGKDGFRLLSSGTVSEIKNGKIISSSMDDPSFVKLMQAITKANELKAEESLNVGMELAVITKCIKQINFGNIAPELVAKDILGIRFISKSGMSLDGTSNVKCSSSGNFDHLLDDDSAGNPALIKAALTNLFAEKPGIRSHIIYKAIAGSAIHANFVGKMCRLGIMQNVPALDNLAALPIAKQYFTKSAKSGNLEAEYNLAKLEANDNNKKAAIEKVAKKGFQPAIQDYADLQIKTPGQQDSKKLYYSALEKLSWYSQFKEGEKFATTDFEGKKLEFEISKYDEAKGFSLKIKRAGSHQFVDFATLSSLSSPETMSVKNFKGENLNALDANNANQVDVRILSKLVSEITAEKEQTNDLEKQIQVRPSSSVFRPFALPLGNPLKLFSR